MMMSNRYAVSSDFNPRKNPSRSQSVIGPGTVSSDTISDGFDTAFNNLLNLLTTCEESNVERLNYIIIMIVSVFDDYVRRIIHYRYRMIFEKPDIVNSIPNSFYREFKVPLYDIAVKKGTLDNSIGKIIKEELRYRSFQSYRNLVDGCRQVGIDVASFEQWDKSIAVIFEIRSQLVHHAGKGKDGKVTTINKDSIEKVFTTIKSVKDAIQKSVKDLDKVFYRSELNNGNYQANRIRE